MLLPSLVLIYNEGTRPRSIWKLSRDTRPYNLEPSVFRPPFFRPPLYGHPSVQKKHHFLSDWPARKYCMRNSSITCDRELLVLASVGRSPLQTIIQLVSCTNIH